MKFRPRHLACLILLLSSLSSAEGSLLHSGGLTLGGHYIAALLAHDHNGIRSEAPLGAHTRDLSHLEAPVAFVLQHRAAFALRPPSAHSMQLQAVTSFGA